MEYKQGKLVSNFLNDATETHSSYWLKIQKTFKSSISFSLKHLFISLTHSTQVTSVPLIVCLNPCFNKIIALNYIELIK